MDVSKDSFSVVIVVGGVGGEGVKNSSENSQLKIFESPIDNFTENAKFFN